MTISAHLMLASRAGTQSPSSRPFHLMKNMSSPHVSVAPTMLSGSSPRSKPLRRASSTFLLLLFVAVDLTDFLFKLPFFSFLLHFFFLKLTSLILLCLLRFVSTPLTELTLLMRTPLVLWSLLAFSQASNSFRSCRWKSTMSLFLA